MYTKQEAIYKAMEPLFDYLQNWTEKQKRDALCFLNSLNKKIWINK